MKADATNSSQSTEKNRKPNILLIVADDLGYSDLGSYGGEINTPVLDRLAQEGMLFTDFYVSPTCSVTRSMLLTGTDNHIAGLGNMGELNAPNQIGKPGYEGVLNKRVATIAELLRTSGYHTYMAGKWHLGKTKKSIPAARGFERSISLMESGADNFEKKSYLPMYDFVHFYEDFEQVDLPDDFFSTDYYTDRLIENIGADRDDDKPFFGYLSLQAQHYPLQAPEEYIKKYEGAYDVGWDEIRARRYARQVELGLIPAGLTLPPIAAAPPWDSLSEEDRRMYAKRMAVYAGMLENVDANMGRLQAYLEKIGEADNTVIVFMSDNGADNNEQWKAFPDWYAANFDLSYERMGQTGSYTDYGPGWAGASGTPLTLFKGAASEGGMRVPLIISGPAGIRSGVTTDAFAFVTDVTPTLLELAGVPGPTGSYGGKEVHPINGKSALGLLRGDKDHIHAQDDVVAYEMAGSAAVFRGPYKLMRNNPPFGDRQWRLYRPLEDPTQTRDLAGSNPKLVADLKAEYARFSKEFNVIEVPEDYNPITQIQKNAARNQGKELTDAGPILD